MHRPHRSPSIGLTLLVLTLHLHHFLLQELDEDSAAGLARLRQNDNEIDSGVANLSRTIDTLGNIGAAMKDEVRSILFWFCLCVSSSVSGRSCICLSVLCVVVFNPCAFGLSVYFFFFIGLIACGVLTGAESERQAGADGQQHAARHREAGRRQRRAAPAPQVTAHTRSASLHQYKQSASGARGRCR